MKAFLIPQSIRQVNQKLVKNGFAPLPLRNMQLSAQLAKAGLVNDNMVLWMQGAHGVTQSANAVSQWLNLAPSRLTINKSLQQITAANQPTLLAHAGGASNNYAYLNQTAGNYLSVPDSAATSPTTGIEIIARIYVNNLQPGGGTQQCLASKFQGSDGHCSWICRINDVGVPFFSLSFDGTTATTNVSSGVALPVANRTWTWVKFNWRNSDGLGTFSYAPDATTPPTNWIQFGTATAGSGSSIFDSDSVTEIGSRNVGAIQTFGGNVAYLSIAGSVGGTPFLIINPATYVSGTTFTDSSINAATISLFNGAIVNTFSSIYFDGVNDYLKTGPFTLNQPTTVYLMGKQVTWTASHYIWSGITEPSNVVYQKTSSPRVVLNAGSEFGDNGWTLQTNASMTFVLNSTNSAIRVNRLAATAGDVGTQNAGGFTLGARGDNSSFSNILMNEVLVFNTAHSTAQQNIVIGYLNEKYSLGL